MSLFLEILVVMGGGKIADIKSRRGDYLSSGNIFLRILARGFYFVADHRPMLGVIGLVGILAVILYR
jgi:hypothetical protein